MMVCRSSRASLPLIDRHDRLEGVWKKPKVRYFTVFQLLGFGRGAFNRSPAVLGWGLGGASGDAGSPLNGPYDIAYPPSSAYTV